MKAWKIEHNRRCMELSLLAIESRFDPMNVLELMFDEAIENQRESGIIEARWDNNYIQDPNTGRMMGSRGGSLSGLRRDPKVYSNGGGSSSGGSNSDKQRLQEMIRNKDITLELNETIQNRHYKGTKEYNDFLRNGVEKSYFYVSQSELQDFLYKNATKGKIFISSAGDVKERFDFGKIVAFDTSLCKETTWATVSYSKSRTHFSPYSPMPKEEQT